MMTLTPNSLAFSNTNLTQQQQPSAAAAVSSSSSRQQPSAAVSSRQQPPAQNTHQQCPVAVQLNMGRKHSRQKRQRADSTSPRLVPLMLRLPAQCSAWPSRDSPLATVTCSSKHRARQQCSVTGRCVQLHMHTYFFPSESRPHCVHMRICCCVDLLQKHARPLQSRPQLALSNPKNPTLFPPAVMKATTEPLSTARLILVPSAEQLLAWPCRHTTHATVL
jgi:hypothetical protein